MKKKQFILAFGNTSKDHVRSYLFSPLKLFNTIVLSLFCILTASFFIMKGFHFLRSSFRILELQKENRLLRQMSQTWGKRIEKTDTVLKDLQRRNRQLRATAGLANPERVYGIGGSASNLRAGYIDIPQLKSAEINLIELENELEWLIQNTTDLENAIVSRTREIAHYPSIQPVRRGWITSRFGKRIDPFTGKIEEHPGIDISVRPGTEVFATGAGYVKVTNTKVVKNKGYGKYILIDHGYGYRTLYAHLSEIFVKPGQKVKRWDLIGLSGNSGKSTAPHIHYGVTALRTPKDPMNFILD